MKEDAAALDFMWHLYFQRNTTIYFYCNRRRGKYVKVSPSSTVMKAQGEKISTGTHPY